MYSNQAEESPNKPPKKIPGHEWKECLYHCLLSWQLQLAY